MRKRKSDYDENCQSNKNGKPKGETKQRNNKRKHDEKKFVKEFFCQHYKTNNAPDWVVNNHYTDVQ